MKNINIWHSIGNTTKRWYPESGLHLIISRVKSWYLKFILFKNLKHNIFILINFCTKAYIVSLNNRLEANYSRKLF